jgi:hypothetical protein
MAANTKLASILRDGGALARGLLGMTLSFVAPVNSSYDSTHQTKYIAREVFHRRKRRNARWFAQTTG